jgi:dihydrofolate reductase
MAEMAMAETARPWLVIVAAVASNGAIGARDELPWRLRTDLRRYRAITMGKPMIMGRKTFNSIGKPLPGRETIVVTRDAGFSAPGVFVARDIEAALALAADRAAAMGAGEIIIAGGGEIYNQLIERADSLRITEVALAPEADAFFPAIDPALWRERNRESHPAGPEDEAAFAFVDYDRRERDTAIG